ncbi:MAG: hypothetical protein QXT92_00195 [Nitrososphaerota archaeon]
MGSKDQSTLGFRSEEVFADPRTIMKLIPKGIVRLSYHSSSDRRYRAFNLTELKRAIEDWKRSASKPVQEEEIPSDLFNVIVGHNDVKEILMRAITTKSQVHVLLVGTPASAKSLFLEELMRIPKSKFVLGSGLTRAGLYDVIFNDRPRYLILDEIDKVEESENLACLLSLMERGKVIETKHGKHRSIELLCSVFAGANRTDKLPPELLSRFLVLNFRPYTPEEFTEVVVSVLTLREGVPQWLSLYIAEKCLKDLYTRDPRDAVKIARLMREHTREEVDKLVGVIKGRKP